MLLDFWASWCAPCRKKNKELNQQYPELQKMSLEVISISLDNKREFWLLLTVTVFVTVQTGLRIEGMNADVLLLKKDRMRLWDIQESI